MRHHTHTGPAGSRHARLRRTPSRRPSPDSPYDNGLDPRGRRSEPAQQAGLTVRVHLDHVRPRIVVAGELDLASAPLLTAMLDHVRHDRHRRARGTTDPQDVDVDLARVTFADSSGLAPVLDSRARIVAYSGPVRRVLRLLSDPTAAVQGNRVEAVLGPPDRDMLKPGPP